MKIKEALFAGSSTRVSERPKQRFPEFAFIGRSNVGKSSLINMLTANRKLAMTSAKPGKTRLVNHFLINRSWYLVDLPGYGYAKASASERQKIQQIINNYINLSPDMVNLFVLIDSRHDIGKIDLDFLMELGERRIPFAIIFTKGDKQGVNVLADREGQEAASGVLGGTSSVLRELVGNGSRTRGDPRLHRKRAGQPRERR